MREQHALRALAAQHATTDQKTHQFHTLIIAFRAGGLFAFLLVFGFGFQPLAQQLGETRPAQALTADLAAGYRDPCDILVLAATEGVLTGENAPRIQTKLVAEGANGPTTLEADDILADRGIPVLPDILTNAGGVAVSYFEWVQDIQRLFWTREEIRTRLADLMSDGLDRVWTLSEEESMTLRRAALIRSIREVAGALVSRGVYP